jgi:hypothetical protein
MQMFRYYVMLHSSTLASMPKISTSFMQPQSVHHSAEALHSAVPSRQGRHQGIIKFNLVFPAEISYLDMSLFTS